MACQTQRCDWLTSALFQHDFWVSGLAQTTAKYQTGGLLTLRFAGHFPVHMQPPPNLAATDRQQWLPSHYDLLMGFLAVELSTQTEVDQFVPSEPLRTLLVRVQNRFAVPMAIVAFAADYQPSLNSQPTREEAFFVIDPALQMSGLVNPQHYAKQINQKRNPLAWDEPIVKPINKSINDSFQRWTRTYLSGQLSINDIDALKALATPWGQPILMLCELKRSRIDLKTWTPYLNDIPNFMLTKACARKCSSAIDLVIHYNPDITNTVAVHLITDITKQGITGFRKIISGDDDITVTKAIETHVISLIDEAYTSTKRLDHSF